MFGAKLSGIRLGQGRAEMAAVMRRTAGGSVAGGVNYSFEHLAGRTDLVDTEHGYGILRVYAGLEQSAGVVVGIPSELVSYRVLDLPFADAKRIGAALPFEIESRLPFDIDDMAVAYSLVERSDGGVRILAGAVKKDVVRGIASVAAEAGMKLEGIVPDSVGLYWLALDTGLIPQDKPSAIIGVYDTEAVVCVSTLQGPRTIRTIPLAGNGLDENVREIERTLRADRAGWGGPAPVIATNDARLAEMLARVDDLTAGNAGRLPPIGIAEGLARRQGYYSARLFSPSDGLAADNTQKSKISVAAEIAVRILTAFSGQGIPLNFLTPEYMPKRTQTAGSDTGRRRLKIAAIVAAVLLLADFSAGFIAKRAKYEALKNEIEKVYRQAVPGGGKVVDPVAQLSSAMGLVRGFHMGGADSGSLLGVLRGISSALPPEMKLDVNSLEYEDTGVTIEGTTTSFESVDRLAEGLRGQDWAGDVKIRNAQAGADPGKVAFEIHMTLAE